MNEIDSIKEEVFCLNYELKAMSNTIFFSKSERWIKGFLYQFTEEHHLARYNFIKNKVKDKTVLDIACGCGYGTYLMANEGEALKVIGVDSDKDAIRYGNYRYNCSNIERIVDDATTFQYDKKFDVIISFETIEHIANYTKFIDVLYDNLKDNGIIYISTPINEITTTVLINPYHVIEWSFKDFHKLFDSRFKIKEIYLQKIVLKNRLSNFENNIIFKVIHRVAKRVFSLDIYGTYEGKGIELFQNQYNVNKFKKGYQILAIVKNNE